jgi:ribosomal protein S18 acetylase RimI-like enzyme
VIKGFVFAKDTLMIAVREATEADFEPIWNIFHEILVAGETYGNDETFTAAEAQQMWLGPTVQTFVAYSADRVVGAYKLVPNMPGRGAHVANGSYIVDVDFRGRGIGRVLVEHSLHEAKKAGYKAIQFNFVVSTNQAAIRLYQEFGFQTLAILPKAFDHPVLGYVDAYLMHRSLEDTI